MTVRTGAPRPFAPLVLALCAIALIVALASLFEHQVPALVALGLAGTGMALGIGSVLGRRDPADTGPGTTDELTGLANHRGFHECLAQALARSRAEGIVVSLVILGLDRFAAINEAHGYPYGDRVLREAGARLREIIRSGDVAARIGGDEFALILTGVGGDQAAAIAARARAAIGTIESGGIPLSSSAGVSTSPTDAGDASTLVHQATSALGAAKLAGDHGVRRFAGNPAPVGPARRHRAEVEALLAREESLRMAFQPIVAMATGRVVGFEALARFPGAVPRSPEHWLSRAHACGLGAELEAAAIAAALAVERRPLGAFLALNASPSALASEPVRRVMPADLGGLVIEITEHELVADDGGLAATLADLRGRGARIALDDAGAGHAGLKQLMRVRPDIVKLDRGLIRDIHADPARAALVESFVRFAAQIGTTVCAEGIESLDDLVAVADLDVGWGQGFVLARPAAPWPSVSAIASESCRVALDEALRATADPRPSAPGDRRMVHLSAVLAGTRSRADLEQALTMISAELHADNVLLSRLDAGGEVIATLAGSRGPDGSKFALADYPLTAAALAERRAAQVFVGDPAGDAAETKLLLELDQRSVLIVPVVNRGESIGLLEAYSRVDRPWTRAEIDRARVIANHFSAVLQSLSDVGDLGSRP